MKENPNEKWIVSWETNRDAHSHALIVIKFAINSRVARFEIDRIYLELQWFG